MVTCRAYLCLGSNRPRFRRWRYHVEWWGWLAVVFAGQFIGFLMCILPDRRRGKPVLLDEDGRDPAEVRAFAHGIPLRWTSSPPPAASNRYNATQSDVHRGAA